MKRKSVPVLTLLFFNIGILTGLSAQSQSAQTTLKESTSYSNNSQTTKVKSSKPNVMTLDQTKQFI